MEFNVAARLVGVLYGNILHRNADPEGYEHYLKGLTKEDWPLIGIIMEFFLSDDFRETFIVNQTPNELARNLLISLFGNGSFNEAEVTKTVVDLVQRGFPSTLEGLLTDPRYLEVNGDFGIPRYRERDAANA